MILLGDCRTILPTLDAGSVRCCVTSPPYWGLRDYGCEGQLGLEKTPEAYVAQLVAVFREVRRVLADDGTLWLNLGDSYNAYNGGAGPSSSISAGASTEQRPRLETGYGLRYKGLKPKNLVGIPWRVAFALQADGWYLRSDIIWAKPNPRPESVTDRPTKAHEYVFLLSKSARYFYDAGAIREKSAWVDEEGFRIDSWGRRIVTKIDGNVETSRGASGLPQQLGANVTDGCRNARSVWTIATQPTPGAHFATFPEALAERCILAGSAEGDTVLDPFFGSGTVGKVAERLGRKWIGIELNPAYVGISEEKTAQRGLFNA